LEVDEVMICLPLRSQYEAIARIIAVATEMGLIVRMPADFFELKLAHAEVEHLDKIPIVTLAEPVPSSLALFVKRTVDVLGASARCFSRPILVIACRRRSPPVLFSRSGGLDEKVPDGSWRAAGRGLALGLTARRGRVRGPTGFSRPRGRVLRKLS
jgi:hypothetical protein